MEQEKQDLVMRLYQFEEKTKKAEKGEGRRSPYITSPFRVGSVCVSVCVKIVRIWVLTQVGECQANKEEQVDSIKAFVSSDVIRGYSMIPDGSRILIIYFPNQKHPICVFTSKVNDEQVFCL